MICPPCASIKCKFLVFLSSYVCMHARLLTRVGLLPILGGVFEYVTTVVEFVHINCNGGMSF